MTAALLLDSNSRSSARARGPKTASGFFARGACNAPLEAEFIGDECWRLGLATELVNQPDRTGVCLAAVSQTSARSRRFACLAGRIAGIADTRGEFVGRLEEVLAPGHAGFGPKCADTPSFRRADSTVSNPLVLFPAATGYRRRLYEGRAISVYYDHHASNEWSEHTREQEQLSAILNEATVRLKWKPADGDWRDVKIQGPSVWLIPSGTPHALVCPGEVKMVTMFLEREFMTDLKVRATSAVMVMALAQLIVRDAFIGHLAGRFRQMCREQIVHDAAYVESIGRMLSTHLLHALRRDEVPPAQPVGLREEVRHRVVGYIEEHLAESLSLAVLGRVAGISSSHFGRLFKVSTGLAPHVYVMSRRVANAEQLLLETDKKEIEIASLCGFSDDTLMARWFRRELQCRPSEIRAQRPS